MIIFKRLFQFLSVQLDYKDIGYSDFLGNNLTIASTETTTDLLFISINQTSAYSLECALCLCLTGQSPHSPAQTRFQRKAGKHVHRHQQAVGAPIG